MKLMLLLGLGFEPWKMMSVGREKVGSTFPTYRSLLRQSQILSDRKVNGAYAR
jgi:hypothetical protein